MASSDVPGLQILTILPNSNQLIQKQNVSLYQDITIARLPGPPFSLSSDTAMIFPGIIWLSVRRIDTLTSPGTFLRGVLGSAATFIAAFFSSPFNHPALATDIASTLGLRLSSLLLSTLRHFPLTFTATLRALLMFLGLLPLAEPSGARLLGCFNHSLLWHNVQLLLDLSSHHHRTISLPTHLRPTPLQYILAALLVLLLISIFVARHFIHTIEMYKKLALGQFYRIQFLASQLVSLAAESQNLKTQLGQRNLEILLHQATNTRLEKKLTRRGRRLLQRQQDAEEAFASIQNLRAKTAELREKFRRYKAKSVAANRQRKDQLRQQASELRELKSSFKRKIDRLFEQLQQREQGQQVLDAERAARVDDLKRKLASVRSERGSALAFASTSQQQASSLSETLDFATAEHRSHMQHCKQQRAAKDRQLRDVTQQRDGLVGSLDFATAEHRVHMAVCTEQRASGSRTQQLEEENAGLSFRLSTVSRAYADGEARRKRAETALDQERQRHMLAVRSYRAGQQASDSQIDHLMAENSGLETRLSFVSQAFAAERAQAAEARQQRDDAIRQLEQEREQFRLARLSYLAGQRTSDAFVDHLMGVAGPSGSSQTGTGDMELLTNVELHGEVSVNPTEDTSYQADEQLEALDALDQDEGHSDSSDLNESLISSSFSSAGNTTTGTPALIHTRSFSRSPSGSPTPMTPGSAILPRRMVFKKPDINDMGDTSIPGNVRRTGIVARRRLNM